MNLKIHLVLFCAVFFVTFPARSDETITFDDLTGTIGQVPNGYGGLQYSNFFYANPSLTGGLFGNGLVSAPNVGLNSYGTPANFSRATSFTFVSAYLTSLEDTTENVEVQGFKNGTLIYDRTVVVNDTSPTLETFDYSGVTEVNFITGASVGGEDVVFDNLVLSFGTSFGLTAGLTPNQRAVADNIDLNSASPKADFQVVINGLTSLPMASLPGALDSLTPLAFQNFTQTTAFNNATFDIEERDNYLASRRIGDQGTFLGGSGMIDTSDLTVNDPSYDPLLAMTHSRLLAWNPSLSTGVVSDAVDPMLGGIDLKRTDSKNLNQAVASSNPWNVYLRGSVILAQGL